MNDLTTKQLKAMLDQQFAVFLAQVTNHVDKRVDGLQVDMNAKLDKIYTTVDSIAKTIETDDHERAALSAQTDRHEVWIGQLAKATDTKLRPE